MPRFFAQRPVGAHRTWCGADRSPLLVATVEIDFHTASMSSTPARLREAGLPAQPVSGYDCRCRAGGPRIDHHQETPSGPHATPLGRSLFVGRPARQCWPAVGQTSIPACMFGDPSGTHTMVVYGDSRAGMWFQTLNSIAKSIGWRLAYLGKPWCPASSLPYPNPSRIRRVLGLRRVASLRPRAYDRLHPDLVIITQDFQSKPGGGLYSGTQWQEGLATAHLKDSRRPQQGRRARKLPLLPLGPRLSACPTMLTTFRRARVTPCPLAPSMLRRRVQRPKRVPTT